MKDQGNSQNSEEVNIVQEPEPHVAFEQDTLLQYNLTLEKSDSPEDKIDTIQSLRRINFVVMVVLTVISLLLFIDYFMLKQEYVEIPKKCLESGSCSIQAKTPVKTGKQYLYLRFRNFNQNYRDYFLSISIAQLYDVNLTAAETHGCWPGRTNNDLKKTISLDGSILNSTSIARPCGLIASTYPDSIY